MDAYYTDLANLVTVDTELSDDNDATHSEAVFKSGGTGWARGGEVFLQRRTGALTGWIGYALAWTRRTFPELNDGQPFPPKHDRRHDLSFVASYKVGAWRLGANLAYATGQAFTPVSESPVQRNSARLQPYHRLGQRPPVVPGCGDPPASSTCRYSMCTAAAMSGCAA